MKIIKRCFLILLCLVIPGSVFASALGNLEKDVVEYRLQNGMKWLLLKKGSAPVFTGIIMVKAAGADECADKAGLAHILEHMAFKGTKDISSKQLWSAFVANGARDLGAYTSKDTTTYYAGMPNNKLELWAYLQSEMMLSTIMRDFLKERDVVMEEYTGSVENKPSGRMNEALLRTAFKSGPFSWPVIGRPETLANLKPEDLNDFRRRYYRPDRMVGAIIGDIDIEKTEELLSRYFGRIRSSYKKDEAAPRAEEQNETRRAEVSFPSSPNLMIAYHKPAAPHRDDYVFDLLAYIMCSGGSSRLVKGLVYEKKIVSDIACDPSFPASRLDNLFLIVATPMKGHSYDEVEAAIGAELKRLKESPPSTAEITKARNNITKEFVFGLDGNHGIAESLSYFEAVLGDWRHIIGYMDKIKQVSGDDIKGAAERYLIDNNKTVVRLVK